MLSSYRSKMSPVEEVNTLISLTNHIQEVTLKKWQKISLVGSDDIFIVISGEVEYRRSSDDLCLCTSSKPVIMGAVGLFYNINNCYGIVRSRAVVRKISAGDFLQLVDENNSWMALAKVLAWYLHLLSKRDEILVARSAYSIVREFLFEINDIMKHHHHEVNIYDYIQQHTHLARSTIVKILSDLKKGKYIEVHNGRLLTITSLPERY